ncbi:related to CFT2 - cleavage and polyadenylation specificity factor, part of CF II [Cephalotrichum gorgonifer]|uniref:Cleavage and polyadenylation specificity factor subunit 2 n=1 Tax=Cephalotrichum gorgonifer TaxID=2041049 RepID=A0AAE8T0L1_9PEZI|nr:related to CFT2 - cleavage and polyadenylation specificity factor, part of CF II [Cephalotrichum gorgonifer]
MFNFCPLQGALSQSPATQSLLELDGGVKVLVGLGWDESFDVEKLKELEKQVQSQTISLVLLTHATVGHLAAFAYCCRNFPRFTNIPIYATRPVSDLGRALLQDLYESTPLAATTIAEDSLSETAFTPAQKEATAAQKLLLQAPTSQDLARYFSLIQPLKYSQPHQPLPTPGTPALNGLTITAYNSGRTLGGTIWHIQHGLESIVYAVDWNLARENVFSGAAWLGGAGGGGAEVIEQLRKPTALICSSRGAGRTAPAGGRAKRDDQLIAMAKACVARGGTALIPVDSSARVLELAYILEHAWRKDARERGPLVSAKLYLAGRSMSSTMRYARTMLEWMDDNINREFEAVQDTMRRTNGDTKEGGPFDFKHAKIVERRAQIQKLLAQDTDNVQTGGRVILASDTSLEWGFSKDLLKGLARDSRNVLILTERPSAVSEKPTLAGSIYDWWEERRDGVSSEQVDGEDIEFVYGGGRELEVRDSARQALEGEELTLYQQWLAQRQMQESVQGGGAGGAAEAAGDVVDDASSESDLESEESDGEQQGRVLNISATMGQARRELRDEDLGITILMKKKGAYDFDVGGRRGRDRMFPLAVRRKRVDEFGEVIRPEEYLRAEEKGDEAAAAAAAAATATAQEGAAGADGGDQENLGRKRRWDESGSKGPQKRPQHSRAMSDDGAKEEVDELDGLEDVEEEVTGPSRLVVSTAKVMVNLRLAFVDFCGLHDKRSLNMLIPLIQPRKLIIVGGSREETGLLAEDCRRLLAPGEETDGDDAAAGRGERVFTPGVGQVVDASVDTNAWTLKLADELVKRLRWQNVRGMGIVTVTGRLSEVSLGEQHDPKRQRTDASSDSTTTGGSVGSNSSNNKSVPTLEVAAASTQRTYRPLHVGDLRLADLRREMQAAGHSAEFRGEGTLLVDGVVAVRKTSTGRVEVAGVVGDGGGAGGVGRARGTLYEVRKVIYRSLAVVGA